MSSSSFRRRQLSQSLYSDRGISYPRLLKFSVFYSLDLFGACFLTKLLAASLSNLDDDFERNPAGAVFAQVVAVKLLPIAMPLCGQQHVWLLSLGFSSNLNLYPYFQPPESSAFKFD